MGPPGARRRARRPVPRRAARPPAGTLSVFTVGHSNQSLEDFLALLRGAGVVTLADVRRHPGSRRLPWFASESLASAWPAYVHLGELGGRRRRVEGSVNGGWEHPSFQGYADHMASAEFARGMARLLELEVPAIMCAEAAWWQCHRRLVSDALVARGHEVIHIFRDGRTAAHELTPFAVADGERVVYPPAQLEL